MPTIPIYSAGENRSAESELSSLPPVLKTPSGLAIVEIQGTIKFSAPAESSPDDIRNPSSPVGKLVFPYYDDRKPAEDLSWQKAVYLYVGKHQRLTGEVKKLRNPVAVLRRRLNEDASDELEVAEIVHYKILFGSRPEPVGGNGNA